MVVPFRAFTVDKLAASGGIKMGAALSLEMKSS
jgi:hypothetical protein